MAVAHVESTAKQVTGATTLTTTAFAAAPASTTIIVAFVSSVPSTGSSPTTVTPAAAGWTRIGTQITDTASGSSLDVFWRKGDGATTTWVFNFSSNVRAVAALESASGCDQTSPVGTSGTGKAASATSLTVSTSGSVSRGSSLAMSGSGQMPSATTPTVPTGWTEQVNAASNSAPNIRGRLNTKDTAPATGAGVSYQFNYGATTMTVLLGGVVVLQPPATAPTVLSVSPSSGLANGTVSVTIAGTGFTGVTGAAGVKINGTNAASYTVDSSTQITATVATGTTTGEVVVTHPTNGASTGGPTFTVTTPSLVTKATGMYLSVDSTGRLRKAGGHEIQLIGSSCTGTSNTLGRNNNKTDSSLSADDLADLLAYGEIGGSGDPTFCNFVRLKVDWKTCEASAPTRTAGGSLGPLKHTWDTPGSADDTSLNVIMNNLKRFKDRGVRVAVELHRDLGGWAEGNTAASPTWLFGSGTADATCLGLFYTDQHNRSFGLGNQPNTDAYGRQKGLPYGPQALWMELACEIVRRAVALGYDNLCVFDVQNEPGAKDDNASYPNQIAGYKDFINYAAERLWAINPQIVVAYETNILAREETGNDPIYDGGDHPTATLNRGDLQGGFMFSAHAYMDHANGAADSLALANDAAKRVRKWYSIAKTAKHPFWLGEYDFYTAGLSSKSNQVWTEAQRQTFMETRWDTSGVAEVGPPWGSPEVGGVGFCDWIRNRHINMTFWQFLPGGAACFLHWDTPANNSTAIPASGANYPKNQIKRDANNIDPMMEWQLAFYADDLDTGSVGGGGPDVTPPTKPSALTVTSITATTAQLTWTGSTDTESGVRYYEVKLNGTLVSIVSGRGCSLNGLTPNTLQTVTVEALDIAGNRSGINATNTTTFTTLPGSPVDTTPPTAPGTITAGLITTGSVELSWVASTDAVGVTGYNIYRGSGAGQAVSLVGSSDTNSSISTGLAPATTYNFKVKAFDAAGNLSAESPELVVLTPNADGPVVDSIDPSSGDPGTFVTILGSNFTNAGSIYFGATEINSFDELSDSELQFEVPLDAAGGDYNVSVGVSGETSNSETFTVTTPGSGGGTLSAWLRILLGVG